jgi:formylglycine-generating enzyme required for sulfatase activity
LLSKILVAPAACCIFLIATVCRANIAIETVPIGNPGNPADTRYVNSAHPNGVGAVAYPFRIGKTEVTNAQYVAMLSAVAGSDPYGLDQMSSAEPAVNPQLLARRKKNFQPLARLP